MFRHAIRRFATTAYKAAETLAQMEGPNQYGIQVAKAQGAVNGFVGGMRQVLRGDKITCLTMSQ